MSHTPALSDLQAEYVAAERLARARRHRPHVPGTTRHRVAVRLRGLADRLDG